MGQVRRRFEYPPFLNLTECLALDGIKFLCAYNKSNEFNPRSERRYFLSLAMRPPQVGSIAYRSNELSANLHLP